LALFFLEELALKTTNAIQTCAETQVNASV
jgi:hypothetical protein